MEVELQKINSWDEVPLFESEREEADYWDTHGLGPVLLEEMANSEGDPRLPPPRGREYARRNRRVPTRCARCHDTRAGAIITTHTADFIICYVCVHSLSDMFRSLELGYE